MQHKLPAGAVIVNRLEACAALFTVISRSKIFPQTRFQGSPGVRKLSDLLIMPIKSQKFQNEQKQTVLYSCRI